MVQLFASVPTSLPELLQSASIASIKVLAKGVAYHDREIVKKRGYRWDADSKYWWIVVDEENYDTEKSFLDELCGSSKDRNEFIVIRPNQRYTANY